MKNLLASSCLMFLLAACGGTSMEEVSGETESLATVQSAVETIECGLGCPSSSVPTSYGCYGISACGPCPSTGSQYTSVNGTSCAPITSGDYVACGLGDYLAAGHYISGYSISRWCDAVSSSNEGTKPNKTAYRALPGDDYAFLTCGIGCPDGYSVMAYRTATGCEPSGATPTQKNATSCMRLANPVWDWKICGTAGCPTGFAVGGYSHTTACEKPGDSTTGNNTTLCNGI
jgi:hypothetical protein